MTKDWEHWEDEIRRLYQKKSLHEVRDVLKARGFDASVRAYRMKLEGWGVRKNSSRARKQNKTDPHLSVTDEKAQTLEVMPSSAEHIEYLLDSSAPELATSVALASNKTDPASNRRLKTFLAAHDCTLPDGPLEVNTLVDLLPGAVRVHHVLEVLLLKWQPGGAYLQTAMEVLEFPVCFCNHCFLLGNIFKVIDVSVNLREKIRLTQSALETFFLVVQEKLCARQQEAWITALGCVARAASWSERKMLLEADELSKETMGMSFYDCAFVIAAQDLLYGIQYELEEQMDETRFEAPNFRILRSNYMDILNDFKDANFGIDLEPKFFKFAILMDRWYETRQNKRIQKISLECEAVRRDLALLKEQHVILQQKLSLGTDMLQRSSAGLQAVSYAPAFPFPPDLQATSLGLHNPCPSDLPDEARLLLDILHNVLEKESFLSKFRDLKWTALPTPNRALGKTTLPQPLLNQLLREFPFCHRSEFRDTLIHTYGRFLISTPAIEYGSYSAQEHRIIFQPGTWAQFKSYHRMFETWRSCTTHVSEVALRNILDWWTIFIGARLLQAFSSFIFSMSSANLTTHLNGQCLYIIQDLAELGETMSWGVSRRLWGENLTRLRLLIEGETKDEYARRECLRISQDIANFLD